MFVLVCCLGLPGSGLINVPIKFCHAPDHDFIGHSQHLLHGVAVFSAGAHGVHNEVGKRPGVVRASIERLRL